jgi:hypothetical protein
VGGTTKFEGTTLLEVLTLEEQLGTDLLIDGAASEDRGAVNGLSDVLECLVNGFKVRALIHFIARTMHKFSTATTKSSGVRCAPPLLHSVGLLNVLQRVRLRGPRSRASSGRRFRRFVTRTYA